jgi:hypothetical protein
MRYYLQQASRDERMLTDLADHRPRAAKASRASWRLAPNFISHLYACTIYGHDFDGVVNANGEVGISG